MSKTKPTKKTVGSCDFTLLAMVILLTLIGTIMITSSSYYYSYNRFGDSYVFFKKQLAWVGVSAFVLLFFINFNYHNLKKFALPLYILSCIFLIAVLFVGKEINGAKRWLGTGMFVFQPSEFSKVVITIFMATIISNYSGQIKKLRFYIFSLILIFIPSGLIAIENLSTAIVVIAIGFSLIFIGGAKLKHLIITVLPICGLGSLFITLPLLGIAEEWAYRFKRIEVWFNPWSDPTNYGFQTIQSLYAVGSGGIFGVGLGQSIQKRGFIPEAHNDIIFSVICEELGLFGASIVIMLFIILIFRGIKIAINAKDLFGALLVAGGITQIAVQVIINIAVNTNTIPVTGMPLPFISYGGSSLIFLMISMGIILNVSRYSKKMIS